MTGASAAARTAPRRLPWRRSASPSCPASGCVRGRGSGPATSAGRPSTSWPKNTATGQRGVQSYRSTASWRRLDGRELAAGAANASIHAGRSSTPTHGTLSSAPSAVLAISLRGGRAVMPDRTTSRTPAPSAVRKKDPTLYRLRTWWRTTETGRVTDAYTGTGYRVPGAAGTAQDARVASGHRRRYGVAAFDEYTRPMRPLKIVATGIAVVVAGLGLMRAEQPAPQPQAPRRPNFLFLFADDMRADTIAAHGNPHIRTPTLDDLARRGFSFRNAYVFGGDSGAVCVASRAMLMSGRTLFHVETTTLANAPLLPEVLGRAGYVTFGTGKWHNGEASWLRAFQQGRTVMFGGMSDHTKVPVKDLGANGQLTRGTRRDDVLERAVCRLRHRVPARAQGAGAVLRLRRLHRAARPSPAAAGVPAGLLRQPAAAAGELPAAVPVRQRRACAAAATRTSAPGHAPKPWCATSWPSTTAW